MPAAPRFLEGRKTDPDVTNIRNPASPHWRGWLGVENRCLVPFTSFAEPDNGTFGGRAPVWFAFDETRPLACFTGLWTRWTSTRKVKEGETTHDIFAFLTINSNAEVDAIHPKEGQVAVPLSGSGTVGQSTFGTDGNSIAAGRDIGSQVGV
jgi:putative SOS response-associated peptidase YedK